MYTRAYRFILVLWITFPPKKQEPSLIDYLISKGKSRADIATFIHISLDELDLFDEENIKRNTAANTLLSLHDNTNTSNEDTVVDQPGDMLEEDIL